MVCLLFFPRSTGYCKIGFTRGIRETFFAREGLFTAVTFLNLARKSLIIYYCMLNFERNESLLRTL